MWIFLQNAMISVVEDRNDDTCLMVRARVQGDIERVFPNVTAQETNFADYRYRASIPRAMVRESISDCIDGIDYDNFKNGVYAHDRHVAYMGVWSEMHRFQRNRKAAAKTPSPYVNRLLAKREQEERRNQRWFSDWTSTSAARQARVNGLVKKYGAMEQLPFGESRIDPEDCWREHKWSPTCAEHGANYPYYDEAKGCDVARGVQLVHG